MKGNHRAALAGAVVIVGLLVVISWMGAMRDAQRSPNILLILVDDLGNNDLGVSNPGDRSYTPELDEFASQGVRFTRHYTDVVCAPSRAALLSGQFAARLGYRNGQGGISSDRLTLPKSLQARGYRTHHIGKWLAWSAPDPQPDKQGFDSFFGFLSAFHLAGDSSSRKFKKGQATYINPWLQTQDGSAQYRGHLSDLLAQNAIDKLQEFKGDRPWFINLWTYAPHHPIEPGDRVRKLYPATPEGEYQALLHQLDENIGRVLRALQRSGQADDTIVVIASDNGGVNLAMDNNKPFAGSKFQFLEGSTRTPLMIRWPGAYPQGATVDQVVAIQDIYPTLARAVGADVPATMDGYDVSPAVRGEPLPARALYWEKYNFGQYDYGILSSDGRWRMAIPQITPGSLTRYGQESGISTAPELYDLHNDPSGSTNIALHNDGIAQQLVSEYQQWHREVRRLDLKHSPIVGGVSEITGDDFQRVPGVGGYTFAIGVRHDASSGGKPRSLASHKDQWTLFAPHRGVVRFEFNKHRLKGRVNNNNACHSIIFTGQFRNNAGTTRVDGRSVLTLYVDGVKVDETRLGQQRNKHPQYREPTILGSSSKSQETLHYSPPVILNTHVTQRTPITIEQLIADVCPLKARL
ncbi:MAG: sulfatase-like hydrolase/transferase [Halieaceae bacterium]|nr:sulfatase-like hydrolase/transferase [Halieaceae bacterium]